MRRSAIQSLGGDVHDGAADGNGGGGGGRGNVADVQHAHALHKVKIIHQASVGAYRLGAHAGAARVQVFLSDLRQQLLQGAGELLFAERPVEFINSSAPLLPAHAPEARE